MKVDPKTLKLFVAVVEEGTIAAAALREHLVPAAVSKRISELEASLNTTLLERTNRGVVPTAAGSALLGLARRALSELDQIAAQMQDYAAGLKGQVRIAANISAISQFLPGELKSFFSRFPQVRISLEEGISTAIVRSLAENAADIGVLNHGHETRGLECYPYHRYRLALITAHDHPFGQRTSVDFAEALEHDFVGLHAGSSINLLLLKAASDLQKALRLRIQVTSYDALCLMVDTGLGIGVLPEAVARQHAQSLRLRVLALDEPWAQRALTLCVRSRASLPEAAQQLLDHLRAPE
ncbi:MAG: LysR family transcriptional regulator [Hydrogenophaga sp.]|jgi:DNA-binding transcriptional LysR family regulator